MTEISIHALLAESDSLSLPSRAVRIDFYPRSPCGERREPTAFRTPHQRFLSTLSLRRATKITITVDDGTLISIHALLAESDRAASITPTTSRNFYPRSPCGERLIMGGPGMMTLPFLSTLSLRRATHGVGIAKIDLAFLSTLSLRRAT